MKKGEKQLQFFYIPLTRAEEIQLDAMSVWDRGKRRLAWIQAQNVIWILQKRKRKE